jgi:hypothetical protein
MALLTKEDLEQLRGFTQPSAQIRWLKKQGIGHFVRNDGYPSVTWEFVNHPHGKSLNMQPKAAQPNFGAIPHA